MAVFFILRLLTVPSTANEVNPRLRRFTLAQRHSAGRSGIMWESKRPGAMHPAAARSLALARLEPAVCLVDDVGAAAATDDAAVPVARLQRLQRIANLHGRAPASFFQSLVVGWVRRTGGSPRERALPSQGAGEGTSRSVRRCRAVALDVLYFIFGLVLAALTLLDVFETVVVPGAARRHCASPGA